KVGPVAVALEHQQPEPAALAIAEAVDERVRRVKSVDWRYGWRAGPKLRVRVPSHHVHADPRQRDRYPLTHSRPRPCEERRGDGASRVRAGHVVAHAAALQWGVDAFGGEARDHAGARPEGPYVVGRTVRFRRVRPVAGHVAVDEPGVR